MFDEFTSPHTDCMYIPVCTLFQYRDYFHSTLAIRAREWMHKNLKICLLYTSYRSTSTGKLLYAYRYVYGLVYLCMWYVFSLPVLKASTLSFIYSFGLRKFVARAS